MTPFSTYIAIDRGAVSRNQFVADTTYIASSLRTSAPLRHCSWSRVRFNTGSNKKDLDQTPREVLVVD